MGQFGDVPYWGLCGFRCRRARGARQWPQYPSNRNPCWAAEWGRPWATTGRTAPRHFFDHAVPPDGTEIGLILPSAISYHYPRITVALIPMCIHFQETILMKKIYDAIHWAAVKTSRPWVDLRSVSNSPAAKATIFVPLIGYLVIFNDNIVQYLELAKALNGSPSHGGVSSRLLWIYFGLCFVSIGAVLYGIACPPEVKKYGNANAYVTGDRDSIASTVLAAIKKRLEISDFRQRYQGLEGNRIREGDLLGSEDYKNTILHIYFDYMNTRHRRVRIAITWVYLVGFSCLAVPSLEVFFRIFRLAARRMFL
jgi:hypothetical protein